MKLPISDEVREAALQDLPEKVAALQLVLKALSTGFLEVIEESLSLVDEQMGVPEGTKFLEALGNRLDLQLEPFYISISQIEELFAQHQAGFDISVVD